MTDDEMVDAEYAAWLRGGEEPGSPISADFHAGWMAGIETSQAELRQERGRADAAWEVIDSDYWRNTFDESMARGNAYVAVMRGRLRSVLKALRQERERAETLSYAVTSLICTGGERADERDEALAALSRAEETIARAREANEKSWRRADVRIILTQYDKQKGESDD